MECPSEYPAIYPGVITGIKVVTGIACTISIAAACWVITTYIVFKDLQTTARQLLVNLSIADILVAGSHFVGAMGNYERFIPYYNNGSDRIYASAHDPLCISQGAVTMFSSIALFLWTMCIAMYILALTLSVSKKILKRMVVVMYMVCWGIPIPIVVAAGAVKSLGFQDTGTVSGCYSVDYDNATKTGVILEALSYEVWVYLAYIILPIVYLTVLCYIRCHKVHHNHRQMLAATRTDIKLLLIPISFLLLRIWTSIADIFAFYATSYELEYRCSTMNAVLLFFQAIGLNSQSTVNAILFCVLTKKIRKRWFLVIRRACRCKHDDEMEGALLEETVDISSEIASSISGKK